MQAVVVYRPVVFSTHVEVILIPGQKGEKLASILHVCEGDPTDKTGV